MNKRNLFVMLMVIVLSMSSVEVMADPIDLGFQVSYFDPTKNQGSPQRQPVRIPSVSIEGYTLYFNTPCNGCTLRLIGEDGEVAYAIVIPEGASSLTLPSYLEGDYEIQIIRGNFCFYAYVSY